MATMETVLVTGATGNVGSNVVRELRGRGGSVRAFVRDRARASAVLGPEVDVAVGDLADPESIRAALPGVGAMFLACSNQPQQVELEANAIDAAARANVRRIVKLSALGAEPGSRLAFWDWQGRIERHLLASGVPAVILQPHSYMSNVLASLETIRTTGTIFAPAAGAKVPMVDPRDVAAVAAVTLVEDGHEGQTYALTGPEALTYEQVAEHLSAATGRKIRFVDVPDDAARGALLQAGLPEWLVDNLLILMAIQREDPDPQITDAVRTLTGGEPRTFEDFALDHAALFRA